MLDRELAITIPGHPAPKGSLKCIGGRGGGRGHILIEDNDRTKEWRAVVAGWCRQKWPEEQRAGARQPIGVEVTFTVTRPRSHYGTGRNRDTLKTKADLLPVGHSTGDVDKLLRLILDALQDALVLPDDCAVIETTARKTYVDGPALVPDALGYPGVSIRVFPYDPAGGPT